MRSIIMVNAPQVKILCGLFCGDVGVFKIIRAENVLRQDIKVKEMVGLSPQIIRHPSADWIEAC